MNSLINRYFFRIIGDDVRNLNKYAPETIRRNLTLGRLIHIPIILWFGIGYLLSSQILGLSNIYSGIIAFISALFIYFLDYSVVNSPSSKKSFYLRVGLGFIISVLGAAIVDVFFFQKDINDEIFNTKGLDLMAVYQAKISTQEKIIFEKENIWFKSQENLKKEIDGEGGSGRSGVGRNALFLKNQSDEFKAEVAEARDVLQEIKIEMEQKLNEAKNYSLKDVGLIEKIRVLHKIIFKDIAGLIFYLIFFTLFVALEAWLIIFKQLSPKTIDDIEEEVRAKIRIQENLNLLEAYKEGYAGAYKISKGIE